MRCYVAPAVAPPVAILCSERTVVEEQAHILESPLESLALYGLPPDRIDSVASVDSLEETISQVPSPLGIVGISPLDQMPVPTMHFPDPARLIFDSAKLARLDALLLELRAGGHRALIYFQMTKMIDLMEEYLIYKQWKYLRLDGDSKIEDRRDMVNDWQNRSVYPIPPYHI